MSWEPDWDELYFMSKEFFQMTKDEFLYDHDHDSIVDLLNRHIELHFGKQNSESEIKTVNNPREFF